MDAMGGPTSSAVLGGSGEGPVADLDGLARDGFTTSPLLDPATLDALRAAVLPLVPATDQVHFSPHRDDTLAHRTAVDRAVRGLLGPVLERFLPGQRALMAGLFVKHPGPDGHLPLHQDWTYVDEGVAASGTVWIPLDDCDRTNGGLHAVRGSHRLARTHRGSPTYTQAAVHVIERLEAELLTPLDVPAGHAVVFDHRVLHGSFANRTDRPRVAVVVGFAPVDAEIVHIWREPGGPTLRMVVDPAFLLVQDPQQRPEGPLVLACEEIDAPEVRFGPEDVDWLATVAAEEPAGR